jgi:hypothetical protein
VRRSSMITPDDRLDALATDHLPDEDLSHGYRSNAQRHKRTALCDLPRTAILDDHR